MFIQIAIQVKEDSGTRNDWLISEAGEEFAAGQTQDTYNVSKGKRGGWHNKQAHHSING